MNRANFIKILKKVAQPTNATSPIINLCELLESFEGSSSLPIIIGANSDGDRYVGDLTKMPHLLVAGATGMGKTTYLNDIIVTLLYSKSPKDLQLVLIDPKMVEFGVYRPLKDSYLFKFEELNEPIITDHYDTKKALNSLCGEMERRYSLLKDACVFNIAQYNKQSANKLPYIVVVIDEYADLILTLGEEFETPIARLAQKASAVGMHLIIATQRPSTDVISGLIKANFPARVAFRVNCAEDSEVILDTDGAERLLGRGDMIFSSNGTLERLLAPFIDSPEISAFVDMIASTKKAQTKETILPHAGNNQAQPKIEPEEECLLKMILLFTSQRDTITTSTLQRQFGIGYNQAGRLMDYMEAQGYVGPSHGASPREVFLTSSDIDLKVKFKTNTTGVELWNKCLRFIRENITPGNYAWFEAIHFLSFSGNELVLAVPSEVHVKVLEDRFFKVLAMAIRKHYGDNVKLLYRYSQNQE